MIKSVQCSLMKNPVLRVSSPRLARLWISASSRQTSSHPSNNFLLGVLRSWLILGVFPSRRAIKATDHIWLPNSMSMICTRNAAKAGGFSWSVGQNAGRFYEE